MGALLKKLLDLFSAFFAIWVIVWFVKFLFTSKYGWMGWLAIIYTFIRVMWFPEECTTCLDPNG